MNVERLAYGRALSKPRDQIAQRLIAGRHAARSCQVMAPGDRLTQGMQARRRLLQIAVSLAALAIVAGIAVTAKAWWDSRLPSRYGVMDYGALDYGGGAVPAAPITHPITTPAARASRHWSIAPPDHPMRASR